MLANVLGKTVDSLLSESSEHSETLIAIDGGGTKTEFCLVDKSGVVKSRIVLGGTNPNAYGLDTTLSTLYAGIERLRLTSPKIDAIYAGIAGCGLKANQEQVLKELARRYPDIKCKVDSDIPSIIYSTDKHEDCIAVIMGTGSVVCAAKGGILHRIGGYGYLFDGGYCGFTLGREAIVAALKDEDGTGEQTLITTMVQKQLGGKTKEMLTALYSESKDFIAGFAKIVFEAYDKDDSVAMQIVNNAISYTLEEICAAKARFNTSSNVILAGGLTSRRDIFEENAKKCHLSFTYPTLPPIYGAAVCASRFVGEVPNGFYERFKESYENLIEKDGKRQ